MQRAIEWLASHRTVVGLSLVAAVAAIAYLPALRLGFYGDDWIFYDLAGRLPLSEYLVKYLDPRVQTAWYRPVQGILFRLEFGVFGANPLGYHALNVFLHVANSLWLALILSRMAPSGQHRAAFVAALIFAALPTAALAVFWVGVIDTLETFFYLAAIWLWLAYLDKRRTRYFIMTIVAFLLALFTKEIGVTLPVVLFLVDRFVCRQPLSFKGFVKRYAVFGTIWIVYAPIEVIVMRRSVFVNQIGYAPDALRLLGNLFDYAAILAFPWGFMPGVSHALLSLAALLLGYFVLVKRIYALVPLIAGAVLTVLPVASFPFVTERFLYLACAFVAVLIALFFELVLRKAAWARSAAFLLVAGLVVWGGWRISTAAEDYGEWARVSRVPFRNVSQAHLKFQEDTLLYFVDPPVPGPNLSGMFLWRYGPGVKVLATDMDRQAGLRDHAQTLVYYFDGEGNQKEQPVDKQTAIRIQPALPIQFSVPIRLEGAELASTRVMRGDSILLFLYWRGLELMQSDYVVSVSLLSGRDDVIFAYAKSPRNGEAPTSGWIPQELVVEVVQIPVTAETPIGSFRLELGLDDPSTKTRVGIQDSASSRIVIEPVSVVE